MNKMNNMWGTSLGLLASYLLGSVPSGYLASKLLGKKDPRFVGSGNVGTMNVLRNVGVAPGLVTMGLDVGKGALAAALCIRLAGPSWSWSAFPLTVLAHNWMPWLGFRGGKGIAVAVGALAVLHMPMALAFLLVLALLAAVLRNADLASSLAFAFLVVAAWACRGSPAQVLASAAALGIHLVRVSPDLRVSRRP
ncbi:MAG: glycerol-3-phosphate acyltransferase [Bacillota bacterium]